jgi:predicted HD phosphohydrolase
MTVVHHGAHLVKRCVGMLSRRPVGDTDEAWVRDHLTVAELALWRQMSVADRRHSIEVARRFVASAAGAGRDDVAAALLHDIGKLDSDLGVGMRIAATLVGPRTQRFRRYHDHERIGADMLRAAGSSERTASLVDGSSTDDVSSAALRAADDI